ncbi:MAG: hypothetical protein HY318_16510 [Armatimonadetes bacterium]|nr:hypothetical protein [Armatimonadota bacterium]
MAASAAATTVRAEALNFLGFVGDDRQPRREGLAALPRGSAEWNQFNSLPTETQGSKRPVEGTGQDPGGGGDPASPPS